MALHQSGRFLPLVMPSSPALPRSGGVVKETTVTHPRHRKEELNCLTPSPSWTLTLLQLIRSSVCTRRRQLTDHEPLRDRKITYSFYPPQDEAFTTFSCAGPKEEDDSCTINNTVFIHLEMEAPRYKKNKNKSLLVIHIAGRSLDASFEAPFLCLGSWKVTRLLFIRSSSLKLSA